MINNVTLVGRLTRDVDLRYTPNGKAVANFGLAVNRPFKNSNGENEADFINCQAWGKTAENLANYMKKGSQIGVVGRIQTRSYENNEGRTIYVTEVVTENIQFLESKKVANKPIQQQRIDVMNQEIEKAGEPIEINIDDLPF